MEKVSRDDRMKQIGTWSRSKGSIIVTVMKRKIKYIGDLDDPFSPIAVERDLEHELKKIIVLMPTSKRGGKIITP